MTAQTETYEILSLTPIDRYEAPQYLIETHPLTLKAEAEEIEIVRAEGFEVLDIHIIGWDGHNAVIRSGDDDYLATLNRTSRGSVLEELSRAETLRCQLCEATVRPDPNPVPGDEGNYTCDCTETHRTATCPQHWATERGL